MQLVALQGSNNLLWHHAAHCHPKRKINTSKSGFICNAFQKSQAHLETQKGDWDSFHATTFTLINFNSFTNWNKANPFFPLLVNRIKQQLLWQRAEMPTTFAILAYTKPVQVHLSVFTDLNNAPHPSTKNSISVFPGYVCTAVSGAASPESRSRDPTEN